MIIGGIAVIARGVSRQTADADATVWAEGLELEDLLDALRDEGFVPRIEDAADFAHRHQVLLLAHGPSSIELDLSLAWLPFEREAIRSADPLLLAGVEVPVARVEPPDLQGCRLARPGPRGHRAACRAARRRDRPRPRPPDPRRVRRSARECDASVIGHPMGLEKTVSEGIVSAIRKLPKLGEIMEITAPFSPGSSGGPVFNATGRVIGVARATFRTGQNLNFAVPLGQKVLELKGGGGQSLSAFSREMPGSALEKFQQGRALQLARKDYSKAVQAFQEAITAKSDFTKSLSRGRYVVWGHEKD